MKPPSFAHPRLAYANANFNIDFRCLSNDFCLLKLILNNKESFLPDLLRLVFANFFMHYIIYFICIISVALKRPSCSHIQDGLFT